MASNRSLVAISDMTTSNNLLWGDQLGVVFHDVDEMLCWVQTFWFKMVPEFLRVIQDVNNRWNRWSENQSISRWQSMPINRLISIIDEQSMPKFFVIIDFIDYQFSSIINANRSVNWHRLSSIGFHFLSVLFSVKISKNTVSLCILMMKLR